MKKLTHILSILCLSSLVIADDTEIYGAAEIDADERINSNVLFIMDTSGSMDGAVGITQVDYVNSTVYSGNYNRSEFYYRTSHDDDDGIRLTKLSTSDSTDCADKVTKLAAEGRVLGTFQQDRNGWRTLSRNSNGNVRCDKGDSYWLYSGNYMNWYHDTSNVTISTRMAVTKEVVTNLTRSLSNINLGLMRFDKDSDGGIVDVPVTDITTSGALIRAKVDLYNAQGGTPLEEAMHEAARYYRGETWDYGNNANPNSSVATSRTTADTDKYLSPIVATCQKNHIILLTDGEPTNDTSSNSDIQDFVDDLSLPSGLSDTCSGDGQCMDELAYWLQNTDQSDAVAGDQAITTYTIGGFDLANGVDLLKRTANWGGGKYYEANDTAGLTEALESIFLEILATDSTFTAPAVSVNAFNSSEHRDELFYALFRPNDNTKWDGNLKRYRLNDDGFVYDVSGNIAVSESTGFFTDTAKDFWNDTNTADGKNVTLGGMANRVNPATRTIFSEDSANSLLTLQNAANRSTFNMTSSTETEYQNVLKWTQGFDVNDDNGDNSSTDSRQSIGDPLHSEPVVLTYGGTEENPDSTIFFGTNEGFIHGVDTDDGKEVFAFLPQALHSIQKTYYDNTTAAGSRPYGMDGPITSWMRDVNGDSIIYDENNVLQAGEHLYLYAGMRRGGRNYYGLDVTRRAVPKMLFKIEGGTGNFAKLGQTWSKMTLAKVMWDGSEKVVLFFGGGYDTNQDGNTYKQDDTTGNAVYMVDAKTGERLWWSSKTGSDLNISDMKNSIPASLSVVDIDGNGIVDYFFAADTGGRIFRVDLNSKNTSASDFATGGMIASLSVDGNTPAAKAGNRRFYTKPSVSLIKDKDTGDYLNIVIGSGHRAHPLYTTDVENRLYVIKDRLPYSTPSTYTVITEAAEDKTTLSTNESPDSTKLYNATSQMNGVEITGDLSQLLTKGAGWYVTFDTNGEKVLSQAATFAGAIFFNTFAPTPSGQLDAASCGADTGQSTFYALDLKWGTAALNLEDGASQKLANSGIAPRPVVIYRKGGGKSIAIGTEVIKDCRFEPEGCPIETCDDEGNCTTETLQNNQCADGNCFVTPVYWRQNNNEFNSGGAGGSN